MALSTRPSAISSTPILRNTNKLRLALTLLATLGTAAPASGCASAEGGLGYEAA